MSNYIPIALAFTKSASPHFFKNVSHISPITTITFMLLCASVIMLVIYFIFPQPTTISQLSSGETLALLFLCIEGILLGPLFNKYLVDGSNSFIPIMALTFALTCIIGYIIKYKKSGDIPTPTSIGGVLIICVGIIIIKKRP